jgi:hypothetical protein
VREDETREMGPENKAPPRCAWPHRCPLASRAAWERKRGVYPAANSGDWRLGTRKPIALPQALANQSGKVWPSVLEVAPSTAGPNSSSTYSGQHASRRTHAQERNQPHGLAQWGKGLIERRAWSGGGGGAEEGGEAAKGKRVCRESDMQGEWVTSGRGTWKVR